MAHANIYIRKENEARWEAITDKSAWVNAYLERSAPNSKVMEEGLEAPYPATDLFKEESIGTDDRAPNGAKIAILNDIRVKADAQRLKNGLCKVHGIPLTDAGKCLQKGCKYA